MVYRFLFDLLLVLNILKLYARRLTFHRKKLHYDNEFWNFEGKMMFQVKYFWQKIGCSNFLSFYFSRYCWLFFGSQYMWKMLQKLHILKTNVMWHKTYICSVDNVIITSSFHRTLAFNAYSNKIINDPKEAHFLSCYTHQSIKNGGSMGYLYCFYTLNVNILWSFKPKQLFYCCKMSHGEVSWQNSSRKWISSLFITYTKPKAYKIGHLI